jgi:hypothetical protein
MFECRYVAAAELLNNRNMSLSELRRSPSGAEGQPPSKGTSKRRPQ